MAPIARLSLQTLVPLLGDAFTLFGLAMLVMHSKRNRRGYALLRPAPIMCLLAGCLVAAAPFFHPAVKELQHTIEGVLSILKAGPLSQDASGSVLAPLQALAFMLVADSAARRAVPRLASGIVALGLSGQLLFRGTLKPKEGGPSRTLAVVCICGVLGGFAAWGEDFFPKDSAAAFAAKPLLDLTEHADLMLRLVAVVLMLFDSERQGFGETGWVLSQVLAATVRVAYLARVDKLAGFLTEPDFPRGTRVCLVVLVLVIGVLSILKAHGLLHISTIFAVAVISVAATFCQSDIDDEVLKTTVSTTAMLVAFLAIGTILIGGGTSFLAALVFGNVLYTVHGLDSLFKAAEAE